MRSPPARVGLLSRPRALPFFLMVVGSLAAPRLASGQAETHYSVAAGAHALTVPWYPPPVTNRLNPAVMVGADHTWKSGRSWRLFYAVNLGFFRHYWWMTGVSIEPELGIGRSLPAGFRADLRLGLGYMHYFWRRKRMKWEEGRYVDAGGLGNPSVILPVSASLGYRGSSGHPLPVAPFVTVRWGVQGLFVEKVPVLTHLQFLAGVRIVRSQHGAIGGR